MMDKTAALMEEVFYKWWEETLSLFPPARRAEFEADIQMSVLYEELAKSAFVAGVACERKRAALTKS